MAEQQTNPLVRLAQAWLAAPKEAKNRAMHDAGVSLNRVEGESDDDYSRRVLQFFAHAGRLELVHKALEQEGQLQGDQTQFYNWPYLNGMAGAGDTMAKLIDQAKGNGAGELAAAGGQADQLRQPNQGDRSNAGNRNLNAGPGARQQDQQPNSGPERQPAGGGQPGVESPAGRGQQPSGF